MEPTAPTTRSCQRLVLESVVAADGHVALGWVEEEKRWDLRAPVTLRLAS